MRLPNLRRVAILLIRGSIGRVHRDPGAGATGLSDPMPIPLRRSIGRREWCGPKAESRADGRMRAD